MLKVLISKPEILEEVSKDHHERHSSQVLYDTCDGSHFNLGDRDSDSLNVKIHMYLDEFELCNPIGAKRGKHKLTAVYFTIGNVALRFRYNMIFLCMLARHTFLKLYDPCYQKNFEPLLDDLHTLQRGIFVNINGREKKLTAVLEIIMGDNLSSHAIAGFQTNFNSGSICRYCTINYSNFRDTLEVSKLKARTKEIYEHQIKYIDEDPADAALYGIKHKCVFSSLEYFKVTDAFPPDIMHDCLEGVIPVTVYHVLKNLHNLKLITITDLNLSLSEVKIPSSDKPNLFQETLFNVGKIIGTAAQKLELFLILPQVVNWVNVSDTAAWDVYITLRMCMDYILSPVIEKDCLPHLAGLIQSYPVQV